MTVQQKAFKSRRRYNQWVTNQTLEDFCAPLYAGLGTTLERKASCYDSAQRNCRTFLALEAIGGALTLTYGFNYVVVAVILVSIIIFAAINADCH
ncbi:hypothetical protein ACB313_02030 [Klebsiella pneumoniae]